MGLASGQIKTGAPCRSERNAKYNQVSVALYGMAVMCAKLHSLLD